MQQVVVNTYRESQVCDVDGAPHPDPASSRTRRADFDRPLLPNSPFFSEHLTSHHDVYARLKDLGIELPTAGAPAAYVMSRGRGNTNYLSGHLAKNDGK